MRPVVWYLTLSLLASTAVRAQEYAPVISQVSARGCASCGRCDCRETDCVARPPAAPPQAPPAAPPQQQPPGYYAAPPQSGVLEGASRGVEVEGFSVKFPALELKLPSLRFPGITRTHRQPRMFIEGAHAPYVQQSPVAYGAPIVVRGVTPPDAPPQAPPQSPPQAPPDRCPPYSPPCDSPYQSPRCDTAAWEMEQLLRARDRQIEQLDAQVQRMAATMERLATLVERTELRSTSLPPVQSRASAELVTAAEYPRPVAAHYQTAQQGDWPRPRASAPVPQLEPRRLPPTLDAGPAVLWRTPDVSRE